MRKVLSFSGFLMLGLVVSQFLPMMAGDGYGAVKNDRGNPSLSQQHQKE